MDKSKLAETPQEFIDKYKSKRYTASNAGLCLILEYLYQLYRSGAEDKDNIPEHLYAVERQTAILQKGYGSGIDEYVYFIDGMQKLVEWLPTAFDSALTAREAARMALYNELINLDAIALIINELNKANIKRGALLDNHKPEGTEFLQDLSGHGEDITKHFNETREYLVNSLCYINSYNTIIKMIAEKLSIPEFINYKVKLNTLSYRLQMLNTSLKEFTEEAQDHSYGLDTSPIKIYPVPIPENNIKKASEAINKACKYGGAWSNALSDITAGYWRRIVLNG